MKEQKRILIIDDVFAARRITKRFLGILGYTAVEEAQSGSEALALLANDTDFALMITDLNLGDTNAIDLLKQFQASSNYKPLPVILVSSEPEKSAVEQALMLGVGAILAKPFSKEKLSDVIEEVLEAFGEDKAAE